MLKINVTSSDQHIKRKIHSSFKKLHSCPSKESKITLGQISGDRHDLGSSLDALGRTGSARLMWRIVDRRQGGASRWRCWEAAAAAHRHPLQVPQPVARLRPLDQPLCCHRPRPRRRWRPRASCPPCHPIEPSAHKPVPLRDRFLRHRDSKLEVA